MLTYSNLDVSGHSGTEVAHLLSPESLATDAGQAGVIIPEWYPDFDSLLERRDHIRELRLLPVKDDATHDLYNGTDKTMLEAELRLLLADSPTLVMENRFPYWLPVDVRQYVLWTTEDREASARFLAAAVARIGGEPIVFERPHGATGKLVRGTFPAIRHLHLWVKKID